jgi:hypothetical protein
MENLQIRMTPAEQVKLREIYRKSSRYLEFGCGGSTQLAAQYPQMKIVSVDSDEDWIQKVKEDANVSDGVKGGRISFIQVDIGSTAEWGMPKDESKIRNWPRYYTAPFVQRENYYDAVLIDGRFRVSCALAAFVFAPEHVTVAFHDYEYRPHYYEVEQFFDVVERVDSLCIMKKRQHVNQRLIFSEMVKNIFNPW